jgi:hypothetical protein
VFFYAVLRLPVPTPAIIALVVPGIGILRFVIFSSVYKKLRQDLQSLHGKGAAVAAVLAEIRLFRAWTLKSKNTLSESVLKLLAGCLMLKCRSQYAKGHFFNLHNEWLDAKR